MAVSIRQTERYSKTIGTKDDYALSVGKGINMTKHIGFTKLVKNIESEAKRSRSPTVRHSITATMHEKHVSRAKAIHIYAIGAAGHVWGAQHRGN